MKDDSIQVAPLQYSVLINGELQVWTIEKGAKLLSEYHVLEKSLPDFHRVASGFPVPWKAVRLFFGINPIAPVPDVEQYDQSYKLFDIAGKLGITLGDVRKEMDSLRTEWALSKDRPRTEEQTKALTVVPKPVEVTQEVPAKRGPGRPSKEELLTRSLRIENIPRSAPVEGVLESDHEEDLDSPLTKDEEALLIQRGFVMDYFKVKGRSKAQRNTEMKWLVHRLQELDKAWDEPMVHDTLRAALINALLIRRADDKMLVTDISSDEFEDLQNVKQRLEKMYSDQWSEVEEMCPYVKQHAELVNVRSNFSEIIKAHQEFHSEKTNKVAFGLLTAYELQVELRQSQQAEIRLRVGWQFAIQEAIDGLWDRDWKRTLKNNHLRIMDQGLREVVTRLNEETATKLPDLESDGPGGEYEPLYVVSEDEVVVPEDSVTIEDVPVKGSA